MLRKISRHLVVVFLIICCSSCRYQGINGLLPCLCDFCWESVLRPLNHQRQRWSEKEITFLKKREKTTFFDKAHLSLLFKRSLLRRESYLHRWLRRWCDLVTRYLIMFFVPLACVWYTFCSCLEFETRSQMRTDWVTWRGNTQNVRPWKERKSFSNELLARISSKRHQESGRKKEDGENRLFVKRDKSSERRGHNICCGQFESETHTFCVNEWKRLSFAVCFLVFEGALFVVNELEMSLHFTFLSHWLSGHLSPCDQMWPTLDFWKRFWEISLQMFSSLYVTHQNRLLFVV